jgi:hypothetical protein
VLCIHDAGESTGLDLPPASSTQRVELSLVFSGTSLLGFVRNCCSTKLMSLLSVLCYNRLGVVMSSVV